MFDMNNDKISVVIPTCDRPDSLQNSLQSVYEQTKQPYEIIIADNGHERASINENKLLRILELPPRCGASLARNEGVKVAKGEYIAFLDDDDVWNENYLKNIHKKLSSARKNIDLIIARKDFIENGQQKIYKCIYDIESVYPTILHSNVGIGGPNIVVNRESFLKVGGFDTNLITSEDRALFIDFYLSEMNIAAVPDAVVIIDRSPGNRLTNVGNMIQGRKEFNKKYNHLMNSKIKFKNSYKLNRYRIKYLLHKYIMKKHVY